MMSHKRALSLLLGLVSGSYTHFVALDHHPNIAYLSILAHEELETFASVKSPEAWYTVSSVYRYFEVYSGMFHDTG